MHAECVYTLAYLRENRSDYTLISILITSKLYELRVDYTRCRVRHYRHPPACQLKADLWNKIAMTKASLIDRLVSYSRRSTATALQSRTFYCQIISSLHFSHAETFDRLLHVFPWSLPLPLSVLFVDFLKLVSVENLRGRSCSKSVDSCWIGSA